jgi:hypothetical protein
VTFRVNVAGFDSVDRGLMAISNEGIDAVAEALFEEFTEILEYSRDELCPEDSGRLRATAHLSGPHIRGDRIWFVMSYGTDANGTEPAPYAIYVHEDMEADHEPPTQAKFLETAIEENVPGLARRVGVKVGYKLRGPSY